MTKDSGASSGGGVGLTWRCTALPEEYVARFAREARIRESDVPTASAVVTATVRQQTVRQQTVRQQMSAGAVDEAFALLPGHLRELHEPASGDVGSGEVIDVEGI